MTKKISLAVNEQHALIFQAWQCILGTDRNAIYLSGPITTGPRFIVMQESGATGTGQSAVLSANIAEIVDVASHLRKETGRVVIEPGSLAVQNWSQDDYLELWTSLIERHIAEVRFLDGWEASVGCALEYERALQHDVPRYRRDGSQISHYDAVTSLFEKAAMLLNQRDEPLVNLGARLAQIAKRLGAT